jgi:hypothetical protein
MPGSLMSRPSTSVIYAVAVRNGNDLWLLARIRRTADNVYFLSNGIPLNGTLMRAITTAGLAM